MVFALCAVGTFSIAGLTIGKPVQLWHLGDLLLSYIDGGAIKLISIVWDLLCRFVFEPLFEMIIIPLWLMLLGWLVLLTDGCAWLAGVLWACSIGLFLSKFLPIISVVCSLPSLTTLSLFLPSHILSSHSLGTVVRSRSLCSVFAHSHLSVRSDNLRHLLHQRPLPISVLNLRNTLSIGPLSLLPLLSDLREVPIFHVNIHTTLFRQTNPCCFSVHN